MKKLAKQFGPQPWPLSTWITYLKLVTVAVFWRIDTTAIRMLLAGGSVFFALGMFLPLHTFDRPLFRVMAYVATPHIWGWLFIIHALGVFWRIYDPRNRPGWGFAINAYGLGLWIFSTCLMYYAIGEYAPSSALEVAIILAALIALLRTGKNDEVTSP